MAPWSEWFSLGLLTFPAASAFSIRLGERRTIREVQREIELRNTLPLETRDDTDPSLLYKAHTFSVPVDHFHNDSKYAPHSDASFPLRYWFDASHYRPGGPVFVLQSGETDATARLPFLQKGIVSIVAKATNGIGVILEHRYYGKSFPVPDLSTENMRFLTTQQALADEAYFAQHVQFPGLEEYDLTSKTTAWISYGGSYAGAFSAFLRVQYPHVFWGAISSSGVTKAIYDYWAYYKPIAEHAPAACVSAQQHLTNVMDNIWLQKNHTTLPAELKSTFGFADLTYDTDFASTLTRGIGNWQSLNWNPAVSSPEFYNYCDNITSTKVLWPETETKRANVSRLIQEGGYRASEMFENQMLNMIGYFNLTAIAPCVAKHETLDQCHSSHNETFYHLHSIDHGSWRSWPYQYCTEWGYLQTGNTPANRLPLISRTLTLEHETVICREAFNITDPPDVGLVNEYGGYDISYPRLAFVDGQWDPWREATPHAFDFGAKNRSSTASEPFYLIPRAVHHWDENGLFPNQTTATEPPQRIKDIQAEEVAFVQGWMQEWQQQRTQAAERKSSAPYGADHGDQATPGHHGYGPEHHPEQYGESWPQQQRLGPPASGHWTS